MNLRVPGVARWIVTSAWPLLVAGCGGDGGPGAGAQVPLDLGGGIFMAVDGAILGATPPNPGEPDFLFAQSHEWQRGATRQAGP